jgi:hypothetical protein
MESHRLENGRRFCFRFSGSSNVEWEGFGGMCGTKILDLWIESSLYSVGYFGLVKSMRGSRDGRCLYVGIFELLDVLEWKTWHANVLESIGRDFEPGYFFSVSKQYVISLIHLDNGGRVT